MHEDKDNDRMAGHSFQCKSGCVHIVWANVMLTFSPEQFLTFSDVVNSMLRQMLDEQERSNIEKESFAPSLLM